MHRVCLLLPDIATTKRIADHIKAMGVVSEAHIHVVGKSSLAIEHLHLHNANLFQTTNLPQALLRGGVLGFFLGALLGVILVWLSPLGLMISASGILVFMVAGIILGLWISGLIGIGVKNSIVEQTAASIQQGKYLMMLDLTETQEKKIMTDVLQHFPQAQITIPTIH